MVFIYFFIKFFLFICKIVCFSFLCSAVILLAIAEMLSISSQILSHFELSKSFEVRQLAHIDEISVSKAIIFVFFSAMTDCTPLSSSFNLSIPPLC